jgi:hypothetical protein
MTPRKGLYVALAGLVIAVLCVGALCLADASGQPKPSVGRTLTGLVGGFGLIVLVVGLIVHGHFVSWVFAIVVGAFLAFGVGVAFGFLVTKGSEEVPAAFGLLAAIGWLISASILWGTNQESVT